MDFGAWAEGKLSECGSDVQALSAESGLLYAYLNRLFNSGKKGKPIRPDQKTVIQIGEGLVKVGAIENAGEAEIAAGYIPSGYKVVREADVDGNVITYETDPDLQMVVEAYRGASDNGRRHIKGAAELALEAAREGAIGRRAE